MADLVALLQSAALELGYDCFALVQHVDLSGSLENVVALCTYRGDWMERFISRGYHRFDPVVTTSHRYGAPFGWDSIPSLIPVTKRQRRMLSEARRFGIRDGLTVPLHMPGERLAACTFASADRKVATIEDKAAAHVIATFAYQEARELVQGPPRTHGPPRLTDRQIDCVALSAAGKTEWETGRILALSPATVHYHLTEAMRRYGVFNRQQLLFHALRDGLISFSEIRPVV
ncbi:autoinducer binding domain-containing protein [uncultured Sphingomonas sp.]|uniref:LuxR family transcriptional regulator n=1 Tax=uncultured Sphingomonas sp. TaxID=158754 RepID=UPI002608AE04|nr:autoinducer binding domain-containing protein [uncultured Sphingomonas sp.]